MLSDIYKTLESPSKETLYKEKASKFFGYAFPVQSENDVKECLEELKKKTSFCTSLLLCISVGNY